jgi:hypothetical protein
MLALEKGKDVYRRQMALRVRFISDTVAAQKDPEPKESALAKVTKQHAKPETGRPATNLHATAAN